MTAREKFAIGDRVRRTPHMPRARWFHPSTGEVTGLPRNPSRVTIRIDGRKHSVVCHVDNWEVAESRVHWAHATAGTLLVPQ